MNMKVASHFKGICKITKNIVNLFLSPVHVKALSLDLHSLLKTSSEGCFDSCHDFEVMINCLY